MLAFDKTGTLTRGEPSVVEVVPEEGRPGDDLLKIAAALGDLGGHVLGRGIARHAREHSLAIPEAGDYRAVPGLGATATVGFHRVTTSAVTDFSMNPASARPSSTPGWLAGE